MSVVYEKGIVVVPKHIRKMAGWRTGTMLKFRVEKNDVVMSPETEDEWLKEFRQLCKEGANMSREEVEEGTKKAWEKRKKEWLSVY